MHRIATRGRLLFLAGLIVWLGSVGASGKPAPQDETAARFIGTWRLVSVVGANGEPTANFGPHPIGLLIYDGTGHMAVQIMPDRVRPKYAASQPTPDEARAALMGYVAYFGTYTVDEHAQTVTHHRDGNITPAALGDTMRHYKFETDDRLILAQVEQSQPSNLIWERIK